MVYNHSVNFIHGETLDVADFVTILNVHSSEILLADAPTDNN